MKFSNRGAVSCWKGELCASVMKSAGFLACGLTGGESCTKAIQIVRDILILSPRIVYFADNDAHGQTGPVIAALTGAKLAFPERGKDWDEWFLLERNACLDATKRLLWD